MMYKKFIKRFFLFISTLLLLILALNLSIDPYNKFGNNLFNIEYKLTRDDRGFKLGQINGLKEIDNLIIGSSRSQSLDPIFLSQRFGGISYNFGVGGGKIEDALGILLHLEKEGKLPKNILLCLDFNAFNKNNKLHDKFLNSKELNFINNRVNAFDIAHFLSIDTTRSSIKTLKMHLKKEKPTHYFNNFGLIVGPDDLTDKVKVQQLADKYFQTQYSNGEYILDLKRVKWYKQFIEITKKYNINLNVIMTPVYEYQFSLIQNSVKLKSTYKKVIETLTEVHPLHNFMERKEYKDNINYFVDSVHYKKSLGDKILQDIYFNNKEIK